MNESDAHDVRSVHLRSVVVVGAVSSYWSVVHAVRLVQAKSVVLPHGREMYAPTGQLVSHVAHARSVVAVFGAVWKESDRQVDTELQTRFVVAVGWV